MDDDEISLIEAQPPRQILDRLNEYVDARLAVRNSRKQTYLAAEERVRAAYAALRDEFAAIIPGTDASAVIEQCAAIADAVSADLFMQSAKARERGDYETMYRANTAWHRTTEIAAAICALDPVKAPKPY